MSKRIDADIVVVGAGTAGCIVAARVSEQRDKTIVLIEAGTESNHPWFHIPAGFAKIMESGRYYWNYKTEPEKNLNNREIRWPRGKVIGGSGAVNGMVYLRGAPLDYELWESAGARGWSWADCIPYFRRLETWTGPESETRGKEGKIPVSFPDALSPGAQRFIDACTSNGIQNHRDVNDGEICGVSPMQSNIGNGRRVTSSTAYLKDARRRSNLRVLTKSVAQRILFDRKKAVGVEVMDEDSGEIVHVYARDEIVLCAGAIGTPQLLMVSGVGDAKELADLGVPVVADSPDVGKNMQDHLLVRLRFSTRDMGTLNESLRSKWSFGLTGMSYLLTRAGPLARGPTEAVMFAKTEPGLPEANAQLQYINFCMAGTPTFKLPETAGFMLNVNQCRPKSRGKLALRSARMEDFPAITANYLDAELDVKETVEVVRLALRIAEADPLAEMIIENHSGLSSSSGCSEILSYVRDTAGTVYHPSCTCRMGSDRLAVVDPTLRVNGVERLRIADASVMPSIPSTNIQAAVLMIAERASDFIKNKNEMEKSCVV